MAKAEKPKGSVVVRGGRVIDVDTETIIQADIVIRDGLIEAVYPDGIGTPTEPGLTTVDATGKYVAPGFIDAHVHIESSMLSPLEFATQAMRRGTTAMFIDPHDAANVRGRDGITYLLEQADLAPCDIHVAVPSCVPGTDWEDSGATITESAVLQALRSVEDPTQRQDIVSLGLVRDLQIQDSEVSLTLAFTTQPPATKAALHSGAQKAVSQIPGVTKARVKMGSAAQPAAAAHAAHQAAPAPSADFIPDVKHTIAVSSGKGGVGKSTVAVNLALALKESGAVTGLVDVDVYGPDVPLMMGTKGKPGMFENKIIPVEAHGIKIMSIGLLVDEREALVNLGLRHGLRAGDRLHAGAGQVELTVKELDEGVARCLPAQRRDLEQLRRHDAVTRRPAADAVPVAK